MPVIPTLLNDRGSTSEDFAKLTERAQDELGLCISEKHPIQYSTEIDRDAFPSTYTTPTIVLQQARMVFEALELVKNSADGVSFSLKEDGFSASLPKEVITTPADVSAKISGLVNSDGSELRITYTVESRVTDITGKPREEGGFEIDTTLVVLDTNKNILTVKAQDNSSCTWDLSK